MSAEENRTFPILDAITETLRGRSISSHRVAPTIVTSSLGVGSRVGVLTPSEIRSAVAAAATLSSQDGVGNSSTRTVGGKSTSSEETDATRAARRNRSTKESVVKETANGMTTPTPAMDRDGRRTCAGTRSGAGVSSSKAAMDSSSCSECCGNRMQYHGNHHRRHDGRLLLGQRHYRSATMPKIACSGDCCCPIREPIGYGIQNVLGGPLHRSRRRSMAATLNGTGSGPCFCNANGDCCCCAGEGGCCSADRLHYTDTPHGNGAMVTGCHHGNRVGRSSRDCYGNGRLTNGNVSCGGYDEDHLTWDDVDLDGGGGSILEEDCLMAASDDVEYDDEHGAIDNRFDVATADGESTMYDMSAIPWDMMSKWCRYTALANLLTLWQPLEGQLSKYTNVMKGWQYRWFVLNPEAGRLEYYEKEEHKKQQRPRGCLMLAGASVFPSDEDSQTFSINASNGDSYRLKAFDAKERQHWVNRLRATAEYHSESCSSNSAPGLLNASSTIAGYLNQPAPASRDTNLVDNLFSSPSGIFSRPRPKPESAANANAVSVPPLLQSTGIATDSDNHVESSLKTCMDSLSVIRRLHKDLACHIETLPMSGESVGRLDKEVLLLKATSGATLNCLEQCLSVLQRQAATASRVNNASAVDASDVNSSTTDERLNALSSHAVTKSTNDSTAVCNTETVQATTNANQCLSKLRRSEEVEDLSFYSDTDLGVIDEHKNIILHLLSQLKLGMDLTKVVLPTFILEKRSLLEMFADCMAHPELFLRIADAATPEARMMAVVEWYILSFHAARQGSIAKKPYNPIIGECFHCSWSVTNNDIEHLESELNGSDPQPPASRVHSGSAQSSAGTGEQCQPQSTGPQTADQSQKGDDQYKLFYCAEQVSHHPPISAFYFECPAKRMFMEASIWTRSKFMGMSVGVAMIGKVRLRLNSPKGAAAGQTEDYEFSLPSVFARSILTIPWVELGDKVTVQCDRTGYSAGIIFHTKPFYGGRLHRITGEVKTPSSDTVCRVTGEWNGILEFNYSNGRVHTLDTSKLPVRRKCVRPLDLQSPNESRRLWRHVTESLQQNDIEKATEHKRILEDKQRENERIRREAKLPFQTKYFQQSGDDWFFKNPLQLGQNDS